MKVFYRWLARKLQRALENKNSVAMEAAPSIHSRTMESTGMNFTVYRANGGHIIEHRVYDRKTDRNNSSLHIITDDKDLGEEIGKIITFESIRN